MAMFATAGDFGQRGGQNTSSTTADAHTLAEVIALALLQECVLLTTTRALARANAAAARRELEGTCGREEATTTPDTHVLADAVVVIVVDVVVAGVEVRALVRV